MQYCVPFFFVLGLFMTDFPAPARIQTNGITLSVHEAGPKDGLPVLLLHGWPELARSWLNQIGALAKAGFRVIAPDMRGFGGSDAPKAPEEYGIDVLLADLTGLLDALEIKKAVWVGHDWGGLIVWPAALLVPDRVAGVIGVNTPHLPRPPISPMEMLRQRYGDDHYFVRFQEKGTPEAALEGREEDFFKFVFARPPKQIPTTLPASTTHLLNRFADFTGRAERNIAIPAAERAHFERAYKRSGFHGGVNYYRNVTENWQRMDGVDLTVHQPALMVGAELDPFLPPVFMDGMEDRVPDLEKHVIAGCGHWTQWEKPDALNTLMVNWLKKRQANLRNR
jgi:epoxide hydrolase A/B